MVRSLRVGFFLAVRQLRANIGTTLLVVTVMALTFLNLLVVSGLMVGIVNGLRLERQQFYTSDVLLTNFSRKDSITDSPAVISTIRSLPDIASVAPRYVAGGKIEANYQTITSPSDNPDAIAADIAGIDPIAEDATTHLSRLVAAGEYLGAQDYGKVLVGSSLLAQYKANASIPRATPLPHVAVGDKIRIRIGDITHEVTIKGIIASKVQELTLRVYMESDELRDMLGRTNRGVNEIAVALVEGADPSAAQQHIEALFGDDAKIELPLETEPAFFQDFAATFEQMGTILGGIGLIVAFIVVFILVFINTLTRRRYIGILQGIGVQGNAIEIGYLLQALLYALLGVSIGMGVLFFILEPYFLIHPIDFPFSNGILNISFPEALSRAGLLFVAVLLASYIPARLIMRQQIVNAILDR